ncbi:MAG: hypothetical protein IIC03_07260, partial [Proteobacteria bacterium]|nr:hypothetical protein [Pseudomonadota bacterium]
MRAGVVLAVIAAGLAGCEPIDRKYTRRHVTIPAPISGPGTDLADIDGVLKPAGAQAIAADGASDALVAPEYYYGSGRVVAEPLGRPGVTTDDAGDTVSLNFV